MATLAQPVPETQSNPEMDALADAFFNLAEAQLAKMTPERREEVVKSIHATADDIRERAETAR